MDFEPTNESARQVAWLNIHHLKHLPHFLHGYELADEVILAKCSGILNSLTLIGSTDKDLRRMDKVDPMSRSMFSNKLH